MSKKRARSHTKPTSGGNASTPTKSDAKSTATSPAARRRRWLGVAAILAIVALLVFGRQSVARFTRQVAADKLRQGEVAAAYRWLAWSERLDGDNPSHDLLVAAAHRLLNNPKRWQQAISAARSHQADSHALTLESQLAAMRGGEIPADIDRQLEQLSAAGASLPEVTETLVRGYLAQGKFELARRILETWNTPGDAPSDAPPAVADLLQAMIHRQLGDLTQAERLLRACLLREPHREEAWLTLVEVLEERLRLDLAHEELQRWRAIDPDNPRAATALARLLRKQGRLIESLETLETLEAQARHADLLQDTLRVEFAQTFLDLGRIADADKLLRTLVADLPDEPVFSAAAIAKSLEKEATAANDLLSQSASLLWKQARMHDLKVQRAIYPDDARISRQLQELEASSSATSLPTGESLTRSSPSSLYRQHCSACHGARGDGNGPASRQLFPRPRNLRAESFRIVSSANGAPSKADIVAVIQKGLPGSSMPGFPQLSVEQCEALAEELQEWRGEALVASRTVPSTTVELPAGLEFGKEMVEQGRELYLRVGCSSCHGDDGRGSANTRLFDERGEPVAPRNLVSEPMKGGHDRLSLFRRIAIGMPGSPHPSAEALTELQIAQLAVYCESLRGSSTDQARELARTNHERARQLDVNPGGQTEARTESGVEAGDADSGVEWRVRAFCGDCHAVPRPESFHRDAWYDEVRAGYRMYAASGRTDLDPPPIGETLKYFQSRAPERIEFTTLLRDSTVASPRPTTLHSPKGTATNKPPDVPPPSADHRSPFRFTVTSLPLDPEAPASPAISHLSWLKLQDAGSPELFVSDLRSGRIVALSSLRARPSSRLIARLDHPCRFEPCDLDGDGRQELVVADLGSSGAHDHQLGKVVWLRPPQDADANRPFAVQLLATGLGRVADVRPADLDRDGREELWVAQFGMERSGALLALTNVAEENEAPRFDARVIDARPGYIHVPPLDVNGDERLDLLALISQESECVEAFVHTEGLRFRRQTVWRAPDLTHGVNGLEIVDLDGDGDQDILLTNGDSFDNRYVTPWHGVQWLENQGPLRFMSRRIIDLPGACRTATGDFDGDGDLDIVATAWLPVQLRPDSLSLADTPSIVLLEQTDTGRFTHHVLKSGFPHYAAVEKGDFDGDGRLDFVVGVNAGDLAGATERLVVWWGATEGVE